LSSNNQEIDAIINEVRNELRAILLKRRKLIEKLGFAFEKVVANPESICEEIKNCLKEEIAIGLISTRTIEQSCRPEWKKKTKPTLVENEIFSFSDDKLQREQEKKGKKIVMDIQGNIVQDQASNPNSINNNNHSNCKDNLGQQEKQMTVQDNKILQSPNMTIRELIYENKKIQQEKDKVIEKLEEALQTIFELKQKESELVKDYENVTTQLKMLDTIFEIEFSVDYKTLQNHMQEIYKSAIRQKVCFTARIDANKKKVISVQVGRKLVHQYQNLAETSK
jgi:hypothetical protein